MLAGSAFAASISSAPEPFVPDGVEALVDVDGAQFRPRREEYVGLQHRHEATRSRYGDAVDLASIGPQILNGLVGIVEPEGLRLDHAEQHAATAGTGLSTEQIEILADGVPVVPGDVLHQAVVGADLAGDGLEFLCLGKRSGNRSSVGQAVSRQAVGGEADGTVLHRLAGDLGDLGDLVGCRVLVDAPVAHNVEPYGPVAHHPGHVDRGVHRF